jgi:hypothetical protein
MARLKLKILENSKTKISKPPVKDQLERNSNSRAK